MYEIKCWDSYDRVIEGLTQWDINQTIYIKDIADEFGLTEAPVFHFCNQKSKEALVVPSTIDDNSVIAVKVPNILLQEASPLLIYMYVYSATENASPDTLSAIPAKTLVTIKLTVRPRAKPSDYQYIENIDSLTVIQLEQSLIKKFEELENNINSDITGFKNGVNQQITQQNQRISNQEESIDDFIQETEEQLSEFREWQNEQTAKFDSWLSQKQTAYDNWFNNLTETLLVNANIQSHTYETETNPIGSATLPFEIKTNQTFYVFINGILAAEETDYTINNNEIQIPTNDFTSGKDTVTFIVFETTANT